MRRTRTIDASDTALPAQIAAAVRGELAPLVKQITDLQRSLEQANADSFTIKTFCRRQHISQRQFFKLQAQDRGPKVHSIGKDGLRITREAEREWVAARERDAAKGVGRRPRGQRKGTLRLTTETPPP